MTCEPRPVTCHHCAAPATHVCEGVPRLWPPVYFCAEHTREHQTFCEFPVRALDAPSLTALAANLANYGGGAD